MSTILLTSFAPWKADQRSNSSDDLLVSLQQRQELPDNALLMRQVPVNFHLAPCHIIAKLVELRPAVLICCGMAEKRQCLSLELNGRYEDKILKTALNLPELMAGTRLTEISHCAGTYVCNHLYFKVLEFIQRTRCSTQAIFIHVPPLNPLNQEFVAADFTLILQRLSLLAAAPLPQAA